MFYKQTPVTKRDMDWQLVARYFTVKSTDDFFSQCTLLQTVSAIVGQSEAYLYWSTSHLIIFSESNAYLVKYRATSPFSFSIRKKTTEMEGWMTYITWSAPLPSFPSKPLSVSTHPSPAKIHTLIFLQI